MSVDFIEPPRYSVVYTPDPEILARLEPSKAPVLSALGGLALRQRDQALYDTARYDLVAHPGFSDPRAYGETGAEGFVDVNSFNTYAHTVGMIDAYYQPFFNQDFYARHGLQDGMPLSGIIRTMFEKDDGGEFVASKDAYMNLLADLQQFHTVAAAEFDTRVPYYKQDFIARLMGGELANLVPRFNERIKPVDVVLDDGFETLMYGAGGIHNRWQSILIAPNLANEHQNVIHEFAHTLEGSKLLATFSRYQHLAHALRESIVSHIEVYLSYGGNLSTIDPDAYERTAEYSTQRQMLDTLCNGGLKTLLIHDIIDIFTSDESIPDQALLDDIKASFPDHPQLLDELDRQLSVMFEAENKPDPIQQAAFVKYLQSVREYYAPRRKSARINKFSSLFSRIGHRRTDNHLAN